MLIFSRHKHRRRLAHAALQDRVRLRRSIGGSDYREPASKIVAANAMDLKDCPPASIARWRSIALVIRSVMDLPLLYHSFIEWIIDSTGLGDTMLHFNVGLLILFVSRAVARRRLDTMVPLASVIVAELLNEWLDRLFWGSWRWDDTIQDVFSTLFWPVILSWGALVRSRWSGLFNVRPDLQAMVEGSDARSRSAASTDLLSRSRRS